MYIYFIVSEFPYESLKQINISGNSVNNHSTSNCQPSSNKGSINLKNVLEKCADNMVSGTERVRVSLYVKIFW